MPLFGTNELVDTAQNIQLISLQQRLNAIEAYNPGNRLSVLEGADQRLEQEIQQLEEELNLAIQNAINNAFKAGVKFVLGSDATGDLYYNNASGILARLGIGSSNQILGINNGIPAWKDQTSLTWSTVTGTSQSASINTGYVINNAALCTVTLPATAAFGSVIEIIGIGAGGWRLAQAVGQQIIFGSISNTAGTAGQLNSTHQRDCIRLVCIVADTTWQVISSIGNIDVI